MTLVKKKVNCNGSPRYCVVQTHVEQHLNRYDSDVWTSRENSGYGAGNLLGQETADNKLFNWNLYPKIPEIKRMFL